jgi:alcohol dehydrogenase (cytochrome c)
MSWIANLDAHDGTGLVKKATGGSMLGGVVTYEQGGQQYVAFASGNVSRSTLYGIGGRPSLVIMQGLA